MTSALRRLAASSKEVRVRVLGSTKKLTSVLPRKRRDLLYLACADLLEGVSRLEDEVDLLRGKLAQAQQDLCASSACGSRTHGAFQEPDAIGLVIDILQANSHPFSPRRRQILPDVSRAESAIRDGRDRSARRIGCGPAGQTN